jgi:hypothetical protein
MAFWDVTSCSLVDTNVTEELAVSIFRVVRKIVTHVSGEHPVSIFRVDVMQNSLEDSYTCF